MVSVNGSSAPENTRVDKDGPGCDWWDRDGMASKAAPFPLMRVCNHFIFPLEAP